MASKHQERQFAECANRLLGLGWILEDVPEPPDFAVCFGRERFGLEVTEVFLDSTGHLGDQSKAKKAEAFRRKQVARVAEIYYRLGGMPIAAKFLGQINLSQVDRLARAMLDVAPSYPGQQIELEALGIKVFMTPGPMVRGSTLPWHYVNDGMGWVRGISCASLQAEVDRKAIKLGTYRGRFKDVELLMVANRMFNSGRLSTESGKLRIDAKGFRKVYFLSYPEAAQCVG